MSHCWRDMKKNLILFVLLLFSVFGNAQIENPVKWEFSSENVSPGEAELIITAKIDTGWHLYSLFIAENGPVPTSFSFTPSPDYTTEGTVEERSKATNAFDKAFGMDVAYFSQKAVFVQKIKHIKTTAVINGSVTFMSCDDDQCTPPEEQEFSITVKNDDAILSPGSEAVKAASSAMSDLTHHSLLTVFFAGLLGGFAAFFMPCIFPMLPFTVSYFTKSGNKRNAFVQASLYGLFIIVIYVALGLLITVVFGADALNNLATNGIFNLLFFLLLVVFAFSFFGAFELVLPSGWGNKADSQSGKGGFSGLFFMAATLSIVSFSCTGPIIGTLLVEAATMGQLMGPATGMFGFALALAIPFALFSLFPSWLKSLPKSGGWLNSVKVVLGFLELALSLKFLSNVDLAYHWNWFDREVYLVLWIAIFGLMALYLLGKLSLPNDSSLKHISPFRLVLAILTIAFTMYLIPGLWGAPLRAVAAFLPPQHSQDFDLYTPQLNTTSTVASADQGEKKYGDIFHAPYGLNAYFDYEEGMAIARKENKPVMIDFTGHACVNCRKMEADVWSNKKVLDLIRDRYILIQLYVDDKTELTADKQAISAFSGKKIKTIGNKWSDYQAARFNANSQPFYVLLDPDGKFLAQPQGADYNVDRFSHFLETGLKAFSQ